MAEVDNASTVIVMTSARHRPFFSTGKNAAPPCSAHQLHLQMLEKLHSWMLVTRSQIEDRFQWLLNLQGTSIVFC